MKTIEEVLAGFTQEEVIAARAVVQKWNDQTDQVRAWSSPMAAKFDGGIWEFQVKADLVDWNGEPDEERDLRVLAPSGS